MPAYDIDFLGASIGIVGFLICAGAMLLLGYLIQRWEDRR